jgi:hypothetical protein
MITYIIPTTDLHTLYPLTTSLSRLGQPFELLPIQEATSFFDAWKKAMPKVRTEWVILTHQDTEFHYIPELKGFDLGGVAGCTKYENVDNFPWWFDRGRLQKGLLSGRIYHDAPESKGLSIFGEYGDCEILDGACLVAQSSKLKEILGKIDVDVTWDWYDHVLSHEYVKRGLKVKTIPLLMTHRSAGGSRRPSYFTEMKKYIKYYND